MSNYPGDIPINTAGIHHHWDIVNILIEFGADLNTHMDNYSTILILACIDGQYDIVVTILDNENNKNNKNNIEYYRDYGFTLLINVSQNGDIEIIRFLLSRGALVNKATDTNITAHSAAQDNG